MKRNNRSNRTVRHSNRTKGMSAYAAKARSGTQMYGPGCCAHTVTAQRIEGAKAEARRYGHDRVSPPGYKVFHD